MFLIHSIAQSYVLIERRFHTRTTSTCTTTARKLATEELIEFPSLSTMEGFDLVPVDGGSPIHLPVGETLLGRGPFLGVSDKRVSRHHGLLENLNGQLRIKPVGLSRIFFFPE